MFSTLLRRAELDVESDANTPRERDWIYTATAVALLENGDERARDIAEKIENPERRISILQHIDFEFVQTFIRKKAAAKAIRLIQSGRLSNTQRAAAYIDVARLLRDTERQRTLELLEDAVREVNRVEGDKPDRAVLLVGIANQLIGADRVRAWEIVGEVVKEANRFDDYTGENTLTFPLMTGNSITTISIGGENFSIAKVFRALAKDDLYRAVDVAKSFKYDAPRSAATPSPSQPRSLRRSKRRRRSLTSAWGWSVSDNPRITTSENRTTLKGFALLGTPSGLNGMPFVDPRVVAFAPTLGLNLANAFGVWITSARCLQLVRHRRPCRSAIGKSLAPFPMC